MNKKQCYIHYEFFSIHIVCKLLKVKPYEIETEYVGLNMIHVYIQGFVFRHPQPV